MNMINAHFAAARRAFEAGDYDGSLQHLQSQIAASGDIDEPVACLLGSTLLRLGLPGEAAEFFEMAAGLDESLAFRNHRDAALAWFSHGACEKALLNAMKAIRLGEDAELHFILVTLLLQTGDTQLTDQFKYKLVDSDDPKHLDLAQQLIGMDRQDPRALVLHRKLRRLRPQDMGLRNAVLTLAREFCDYDALDEEESRLPRDAWTSAGLLAHETPHDNIRWCDDEAANRLALNSHTIHPMPGRSTGSARRARPHVRGPKIRIGYLSADFFPTHATMRLLGDVLRCHDRQRFEITLFCRTPPQFTESPAARAARAGWGEIADLNGLSDDEAAARIRARQIDILVDLKGHTGHSPAALLNHGLAPVQATWLGFPGSVTEIDLDYAIGDRFVLPDSSKPYYHEKFCRLPESYQPNDPLSRPLPEAARRADLGLPEDGFVFASFNGSAKINRQTIALWARLLQETPGSVLWIMCRSMAIGSICRRFETHGIGRERLITAAPAPYEQHIARIQAADLALDTFPCNGHTTTSDMLWAGLPVLTMKGRHFASRVSESLLNAAGLPDLVAASAEEFVALGRDLYREPERLAALRQRLAANRFIAPLFDSERFCRHLETAYETMDGRARQGKAPDHFDVAAAPPRAAPFR